MAKEKKFLLMSLDDENSKSMKKVLGNKTCKKIIDYLLENKKASEKDLSEELNLPLNTIEYNIKNLLKSGIIEKSTDFFWSLRGKKIKLYELSDKSIIISPKKKISSKIKTILPSILLTVIGAFLIKIFIETPKKTLQSTDRTLAFNAESAGTIISPFSTFPIWTWFLLGALIAIFIITILNWRKL